MADVDHSRGMFAKPRVVLHALGGLLVGAVAGYQLLPFLLYELGLNLVPEAMRWVSVTLGAAIGVVAGFVLGARAAQRTADVQDVARRQGQEFSADVDDELSAELAREFSLHDAAISNVLRKELPGMHLVAGDLAIATEVSTRDRHETRWSTQTAAYVSGEVRFPKFTLKPEGLGTKLLPTFVGIEDINFPSHPEFSRHYLLTALHAENTRRLFDERLLEHLGSRPGLCMRTARGGVLIYRPETLLAAEHLEAFVADAAEIFTLLEASARRLQEATKAGLIAKTDPRAEAARILGWVGERARARIVTRADVEAFVREQPPRKLPANIRGYCKDSSPLMFVPVGVLFLLVGAVLAFTFARAERWEGAAFALLFVAIGAAVVFFFARDRLRLQRLLRHGELAVGRIESVEWSGPHVCRASLRFNTRAGSAQATHNITGFALERLRDFIQGKKPAAVLYDPASPQRFLLVEELLTLNPEYED